MVKFNKFDLVSVASDSQIKILDEIKKKCTLMSFDGIYGGYKIGFKFENFYFSGVCNKDRSLTVKKIKPGKPRQKKCKTFTDVDEFINRVVR